MRKIALTAIILVFISAAAYTQSAEWYIDKPIHEIRFTGLNNIDESELSGITEQFINKKFTDTLFWDLQSKLYALNYFESFDANALPVDDNRDRVIIEFSVTERPLIKSIVIRGNKRITKTKILEVTILKKDDILNNAKVRIDETAIAELYIEEGYPDVKVESSVEDSSDTGYVDLFFNITEGTQTRIDIISFSGNSFASDSTLKGQLESKQQSLFSKGIFQQGLIEKDKAAIEKYYFDSGYIDMKVVDVVINDVEKEKEDDRNYIEIIFYIEEGEQWTFGGFSFEGNILFSTEELLSVTTLKSGSKLNKSRLEADFMKIGDMYYNDGYIYNAISTEELRDEQTNEISFKMIIDEKSRAHIENIIITGNEKTKDYVILREIPLEVGDVFSKSAIMQGLNNLYNTRYFSSVVPDMPYGSELGLMDLVINVEEQNTTDIQFGLTFTAAAGSIPVIGFLKWNDSNFLGEGRNISIGTELSPTSQELSLGFRDSWLFEQRISAGLDFSISHDQYTEVPQDIMLPVFNLDPDDYEQVVPDPYDGHWVWADDTTDDYGSHTAGDAVDTDNYSDATLATMSDDGDIETDYDYAMNNGESIDSDYLMDYESYTVSLAGSGGYTFITPVGKVSLGTGLSTSLSKINYNSSLYRPYDKDIRDALGTISLTDKLWLTASWDTRDLYYSPTKGFILKETFTYTGGFLFGSKHYMKTTTDADAYFKLFDFPVTEDWNFSTVLGLHGQYSMILPQFGYFDTDYDGNRDTWKWSTVATRSDLLYYDGIFVARGWGTNYDNKALLDLVIDFTTPIAPGMLSWNSFLSGSSVWTEPEDVLDMSLSDFYFSLGTGLQIDIPSFPISFFLVKRAKIVDGAIEWQAGDYFGNTDNETSGIDFVITFDLDYF